MSRVAWICFTTLLCSMLGRVQQQHAFIQVSTTTFGSHLALPVAAALPGRVLRKPEPRVVSCLPWLPCLALVGPVIHRRRGAPCFAQARLARNRQGGGKSKGNEGDDPRILTSKIKKAETASELLSVLDSAVDSPIFNHIHASAACTSLAAFKAKRKLQAVDTTSPVIQRLVKSIHALIKADGADARVLANIF